MALEVELETYRRELQNLLPSTGKYVLIHGETVSGIWDTYQDALQEAYRLFELKPFLVKQIQAADIIHSMTWDIRPPCQS